MKSFNSTTYLILILSSLIFMNFQCNDCDDELNDRSNFTVTPRSSQNTIRIGDTLFLATSLNSQIELELSGSIYDNSDQIINYRIEVFEGLNSNIDVIQSREAFKFVNTLGTVLISPARTWEIAAQNTCDDDICEIEFGMIPQKTGYFGLSLQSGRFGFDKECQFLSLTPTEFASGGDNNFEIFNDINLSNIRINGSFYVSPESEKLLYFFQVVE